MNHRFLKKNKKRFNSDKVYAGHFINVNKCKYNKILRDY